MANGTAGLAAASAPGREAGWRERIATLVVFLALGLSVGTWAAAVPAVKGAFDLDAARLSLVLFAIPVASVIATIATGVACRHVASGTATAVASVALVASFALPGLARSYPQLLACGAAIGFAAGSLEVAANGHASDIERRWKSAIMSSFHSAFSLGGLFGAVLGGLAARIGLGLQGQLWGPLTLAGLLAVAAAPALGPGARGTGGHGLGLGRPSPTLLLLALVATMSYLLEGAMADWSAVYLETVAGAAPWLAGAGYAAFSITMAVGRLTGDAIVDRLGPARVLMAGGILSALGLALAVLVPSPWPVAAGFALVGLGAANMVPVVFSAAGRAAATPGAGIALVSSFGFAGFLGGPPLIGAVATGFGLRAGMALLILVAIAVPLAATRVQGPVQPSRRRSRT